MAYIGYIRALSTVTKMPEESRPLRWSDLPATDQMIWRYQSLAAIGAVSGFLRSHNWRNDAVTLFMRGAVCAILHQLAATLRQHLEDGPPRASDQTTWEITHQIVTDPAEARPPAVYVPGGPPAV